MSQTGKTQQVHILIQSFHTHKWLSLMVARMSSWSCKASFYPFKRYFLLSIEDKNWILPFRRRAKSIHQGAEPGTPWSHFAVPNSECGYFNLGRSGRSQTLWNRASGPCSLITAWIKLTWIWLLHIACIDEQVVRSASSFRGLQP